MADRWPARGFVGWTMTMTIAFVFGAWTTPSPTSCSSTIRSPSSPVAADASVRTVELNLESKFLDYELTVYDSTREVMADHGGEGSDAYEFVLTNPCDVETVFFESMPLAQMTNVALARRPAPAFF